MSQRRDIITVVQGDYAVSADPAAVISTVLGSCVAVCLFDKLRKAGGMNHFLLATSTSSESSDLKYGVNAMELLINRLLHLGAERHRLEAKIFGGAQMTEHAITIGDGNAAFAKDFLEKEGIPIIGSSLGGTRARRVQFVPTTGAARQLQHSGKPPIAVIPPKSPAPSSNVTLF